MMVRNAGFLFVHHISALLVLFVNGVGDAGSKVDMRDELVMSSDVFSQALSSEHGLVVRRAAKGFCIVAELLRVSRRVSVSKGE